MNVRLFGREPSQVKDRALIWRGRGWRIDVYPAGKLWCWHICVSHEREILVDKRSPHEHPTADAAVRSVSAALRGIRRAVTALTKDEP